MVSKTSKHRLTRLKTIVSLHEEKKEVLSSVRMMREWVLDAEHILDGSWAQRPEEMTNQAVGKRFDTYLERLLHFLNGEERTEDEKIRLGELFKATLSNSIAFAFVIGHWSTWPHWKNGGSKLPVRKYCPHSLKRPG